MKTSTTSMLFGALASIALAQQQVYKIDPANVPNATRNAWCNSQENSCPLICMQTPGVWGAEQNHCDPNLLQYTCVCSNGKSPNLTEYTQTLPYFVCTEWGSECVANCGQDNLCAADCRQKHPCGAQTPARVNLTSSTTSAASKTASSTAGASSAAPTYTDLAGAALTPSTGAAMAVHFGRAWGLAAVMAGLFGGFTMLL